MEEETRKDKKWVFPCYEVVESPVLVFPGDGEWWLDGYINACSDGERWVGVWVVGRISMKKNWMND